MRRRAVLPSAVLSLLAAGPLPAAAAPGDNAVGMNIHVGFPSFVDACAALGVGWVRVDGNWFDMEPADDQYNWAGMDATVAQANRQRLRVFMTLGYTPAWVPRRANGDGATHDDVPNDSQAWVGFVDAAVRRYRAMGVTHFGMWNEANLEEFWDGSVAEYASLIAIPGAAAVRAACNDCKVLGPDFANVGDADDRLEELFAAMPLGTFDIVTHHSYNGFPETGTSIWDGDRFFNVLDMQRFPFTRRSLRQILDAAGWTGEVWITETGYRADPPGDARLEANQATYVRRVLEEQLARAWYTNTFFYEITDCKPPQPDCPIDGFGLIRANSALDLQTASFPADFRRKPAFDELQRFIMQHPQLSGAAPAPACGDGQDNDNDGRIDLADRGCTTAADNDEADDPPRRRIEAYRTPGIARDGDPSDFGPDGWIELAPEDWRGTEPLGANDLAVRAAARWSAAGIELAFEVTDDTHDNARPDAELWQGDSVQLAFDVAQSGGDGYDATDDHEINFALVAGEARSFRFHGPAGATNDFPAAIARGGNVTRYEITLAPAALPGAALGAGTVIGFSFLVNDADGAGRVGWMELTRGIGVAKAPEWFGEIHLRADFSPAPAGPDAGPSGQDAAPATHDAAPLAQDAGGPDASHLDAGAPTRPDAGATPADAGAGMSTGVADSGAAPLPLPDDDGSCGCAASRRGSGAAGASSWLAALLVAILGRRRRG